MHIKRKIGTQGIQ